MSSKYGFLYRVKILPWLAIALIKEILVNVLHNLGLSGWRKKARLPASLEGKTVVITGANAGIGKECTRTCLRLGAKVVIACRDQKKAKAAIEEILNDVGQNKKDQLILVELDLSSLDSVRACAKQVNQKVQSIDVLINNAGVMMCPEWKTKDGYEYQFGTNHLGHFLLTNLLISKLKAAPSARIVNLSSLAHMTGTLHLDNPNMSGIYRSGSAYSRSKMANILFTLGLYDRLRGSTISVYAVHPGIVNTELTRHFPEFIMKLFGPIHRLTSLSPEMGAQTSLHCAISDDTENQSGFYYANCTRVQKMPELAMDPEEAAKLWTLSEKLVDIQGQTYI